MSDDPRLQVLRDAVAEHDTVHMQGDVVTCQCGQKLYDYTTVTPARRVADHLDQVRLDTLDRWEAEQRAAAHPLGPEFAIPVPDDAVASCTCRHCKPNWWGMTICSTCGNKRCPHATHHAHACTGSNASGQAGSVY